ncbi:MAG: hypothetical protein RLY16_2135 [Bacteroidota bacterium]|jgi:phosphoribosylanthranilate isomerase
MKIKVCGITQIGQLLALQDLGIDYVGLIFVPSSKRFVLNKLAMKDLLESPIFIKKVGVFVNQSFAEVVEYIGLYQLDAVQLHGDESPEFCTELRQFAEVWKVIHVQDSLSETQLQLNQYAAACDKYLLDTQTADGQRGGTGIKFDWSLLQQLQFLNPFVLSGGINIADVTQLMDINHPQLEMVDINSKFEIAPGIKDIHLIQQFRQGLVTNKH